MGARGAGDRRTGAEGRGALLLLLLLVVTLERCEGLPEVIKLGQSSHSSLARRTRRSQETMTINWSWL